MKNADIKNSQISFGLEFFKKVSDYFCNLTDKEAVLICPKHRVEHTGKNVYSAVIDMNLYRLSGEEKYYERAKARIKRTIKNLAKDPDFGYWIFYPGRLSRWNMSGSVIDAGACVDTLSSFYLVYADKLDSGEKEAIEEAIFKNSDTYLNDAVVGKEVTNQRLWGGTGLSKAYQIFRVEEWRQSLLRSIEKSLKEMWPDGTFPYHPYWEESKISKGIYDTTTFYHSRCIAFIYYILENIGENPDKYNEKLLQATDLLVAMYQPDGVKNINLECKRWYWNSSYEVASNAFDIYALIRTYQLTGNKIYVYYAQKALRQILRHQLKDGGITSHLSKAQNNFQCRVFWNSNLAWLAKVAEEAFSFKEEGEWKEELRYFENSGIAKFKNENYACILRGRKQPMSLTWGPAIGGGSLLYFGTRKNGWKNVLQLKPWEENAPANFVLYAKENYFKNLKQFFAENRREIRERIFQISTELRTPNLRSFLSLLLSFFKMLILSGKAIYTSQWAADVDARHKDNKVIFELVLARRNGKELGGTKLKREYEFQDNALSVKENLSVENAKIKKIKYIKIPIASNLKIITDLKYSENDRNILFYPVKSKSHFEISFSLKTFIKE